MHITQLHTAECGEAKLAASQAWAAYNRARAVYHKVAAVYYKTYADYREAEAIWGKARIACQEKEGSDAHRRV